MRGRVRWPGTASFIEPVPSWAQPLPTQQDPHNVMLVCGGRGLKQFSMAVSGKLSHKKSVSSLKALPAVFVDRPASHYADFVSASRNQHEAIRQG